MATGIPTGAAIAAILILSAVLCAPAEARQRRDHGAPDVPAADEKIFNVLDHGTKRDPKTDNALAFIRTFQSACEFKGKARVLVPPGEYMISQAIFVGPCQNPGPLVFQILGTLKAVTDVSLYPSSEWLMFMNIKGLRIIGTGTINAQGEKVWHYNNCRGNANCQLLPTSLKFMNISDGLIRGMSSINSMSFHMFITKSDNIRVQKSRITAPDDSPNTDGIHINESEMIKITRTVIRTGDDCISVGQGSTSVTITRVTCGPGHGISVGSLGKYPDEKDVKGLLVSNCTFVGTENGVRIKTWPGSQPSRAEGLVFEDLVMENVRTPVLIDQQYCAGSCGDRSPSKVKISNVRYRNIRGTSALPAAVNLLCSKSFPCSDISFSGMNLKFGVSHQPTIANCSNANAGFLGAQIPPRCT